MCFNLPPFFQTDQCTVTNFVVPSDGATATTASATTGNATQSRQMRIRNC